MNAAARKVLSALDRITGGSGDIGNHEDVYADPADVRPAEPAPVAPTTPAIPAATQRAAAVDPDPDPFADDEDDDEAEGTPAAPTPAPVAPAAPAPAPQAEAQAEPASDPDPDEDVYAAPGDSEVSYGGEAPAFLGYALRLRRSYPTKDGGDTFTGFIDAQEAYTAEKPTLSDADIRALMSAEMEAGKLRLIAAQLTADGKTAEEELPADDPMTLALLADYGRWVSGGESSANPAPAQPETPAAPDSSAAPAATESATESSAAPAADDSASAPAPEDPPAPESPAPAPVAPTPENPAAPAPTTEESPRPFIWNGIDLAAMSVGLSEKDKILFYQSVAQAMVAQVSTNAQPAPAALAAPSAPEPEVKLPDSCVGVDRPKIAPADYK